MDITLILFIKNSMESYKQMEAMSSGRQKGGGSLDEENQVKFRKKKVPAWPGRGYSSERQ